MNIFIRLLAAVRSMEWFWYLDGWFVGWVGYFFRFILFPAYRQIQAMHLSYQLAIQYTLALTRRSQSKENVVILIDAGVCPWALKYILSFYWSYLTLLRMRRICCTQHFHALRCVHNYTYLRFYSSIYSNCTFNNAIWCLFLLSCCHFKSLRSFDISTWVCQIFMFLFEIGFSLADPKRSDIWKLNDFQNEQVDALMSFNDYSVSIGPSSLSFASQTFYNSIKTNWIN